MKKTGILISLSLLGLLLFIYAAPPGRTEEKDSISFVVPEGWPEPVYKFKDNKLTLSGYELGRKLFYDPRLSRNNTVSCGSCHQPFAAFAHIEHNVSHGVDNKLGTRNTPPLFNLNWHTSFFWDGNVTHIEMQPVNPMTNPVEMDQSVEALIPKLQADEAYKTMFSTAFGTAEITSARIFKALTQFMGMLVSNNSKYDKYMRKEPGVEFTSDELQGLTLFRQKCAGCHKEPLFSDFTFRNNGLPPKYGSSDSGRAKFTKLADDLGKFKVPSLRNLMYTPPYMHDGRFNDLYEVIEHYANQKYPSPNIDPAVKSLYLTPQQKTYIIAFLNTLNDGEFVKDPRFKDTENKFDVSNEHHSLQR